jgi:hypothetical protein
VSVEGDPVPDNNQAAVTFTVVSDESRTLGIGRQPGPSVVITWPVSPVPLTLQSATNVIGPWTAVPTIPAVIQGFNVVTNNIGAEQYYRLIGP